METRLKHILVAGTTGFALLERKRLERDGHHVMAARTCDEALAALAQFRADLVITQSELPEGTSGLDLEDLLVAAGYRIPLVMVTGDQDEALVMSAYRAGKRDFPMRSTPHISGLPELVNRALASR